MGHVPLSTLAATNYALDGADYESTYGVTTSGDALPLALFNGSNVGPRVYPMADKTTYQMFALENAGASGCSPPNSRPFWIHGPRKWRRR